MNRDFPAGNTYRMATASYHYPGQIAHTGIEQDKNFAMFSQFLPRNQPRWTPPAGLGQPPHPYSSPGYHVPNQVHGSLRGPMSMHAREAQVINEALFEDDDRETFAEAMGNQTQLRGAYKHNNPHPFRPTGMVFSNDTQHFGSDSIYGGHGPDSLTLARNLNPRIYGHTAGHTAVARYAAPGDHQGSGGEQQDRNLYI
jgi:hypothetical protein